jgi:isopentenyl diphosphate isomerase/L-lactate dehydrogenase-like FMN-dependent dehydrogenase
LPTIRARVGADYPLLADGGIRSGSDVFLSLALGANAVLIGRPLAYALAVDGAAGVARLLRLIRDELEVTMALAGCPTLADITPASLHLVAAGPVDCQRLGDRSQCSSSSTNS